MTIVQLPAACACVLTVHACEWVSEVCLLRIGSVLMGCQAEVSLCALSNYKKEKCYVYYLISCALIIRRNIGYYLIKRKKQYCVLIIKRKQYCVLSNYKKERTFYISNYKKENKCSKTSNTASWTGRYVSHAHVCIWKDVHFLWGAPLHIHSPCQVCAFAWVMHSMVGH